jgi:hypothetical protein
MPARPPARGDVVKGQGFTLLSGGGDVGRVGDVGALMWCHDPSGVVMYCGTVPVGA